MHQIQVDRTACQGFGNCVLAAPHCFDLDDDGLVTLLEEHPPHDRSAAAEQAAYDCPTDAITVVESGSA